MTIHAAAIIGTVVVLMISSIATWLTQRRLQRRRAVSDSENADFRQWQILWFAYTIPLAVITWVIFTVTGLL